MADSVGKGIALGERFKYDTTSGTAVFNNAMAQRAAEARKAESDAVSALDFKIDYKEWLPVYGKAAAEKQAELYNKYLQYKSENKSTALNRIQSDLYNARQEIGRLKGDNDRAKAYVTQKDGMLRNASLVKDLTSTETALADLSKYNDNYFTTVGANGEFAFRPVEEMQPASFINYDDQDYDKVIGRSKRSETAGKMDVEYVEVLKPEAVKRNAESLALNPQFADNVLAANPSLINLPPAQRVEAIYNAAFDVATKMQRPNRSEWIMADLPNDSGSGSGSDKREKPVIGGPSTESLSIGTSGGGKEQVRKDVYYPWAADVPNAPETVVPLDSRVIDYETNKFISGDDIGKIVTFRPKKIYPQLIKSTGKTELYVIGTAQIEVTAGRDEKVIKEFNYKVPYDKVKDAIGTKYDLTDVDEKMKGTELKPVSGSAKKTEPATQNRVYKHKATKSDGTVIFSADGQSWYDNKGNIVNTK